MDIQGLYVERLPSRVVCLVYVEDETKQRRAVTPAEYVRCNYAPPLSELPDQAAYLSRHRT